VSVLNKRTRPAVLLVVFGLCLTTGAFGFDLDFGVKAGICLPWYRGSGYEEWLDSIPIDRETKLAFSGGAFLTIGITDVLAIQPEVLFSQLGGHSGDGFYVWNDKANSIDIAALLKARIRTSRRTILDLFAGPDLLVKAGRVDFEMTDPYGGVWLYGYWDDEYLRDPLLGLVFGLGLEVPLGSYFITVDGRFCLGVTSRFTESADIGAWYQNSVQLMIGTGFVLVGKRESISRLH
jgi:hypothetical protein